MDAGKAGAGAGLEHARGVCNRLYNFFVRHFASQGTKLVTLGRRRHRHRRADAPAPVWAEGADATEEDFYSASPGASTVGSVRAAGRDVPIGDAAAGRKTNINERSDAFIRSRKEALRSETTSVRRRSPPRQ